MTAAVSSPCGGQGAAGERLGERHVDEDVAPSRGQQLAGRHVQSRVDAPADDAVADVDGQRAGGHRGDEVAQQPPAPDRSERVEQDVGEQRVAESGVGAADPSTTRSPRSSRRSSVSSPTISSRRSTGRGSLRASSSRAVRSSGRTPSSRPAISSRRRGGAVNGPVNVQMPLRSARVPPSTAAARSSRANRTLPRVRLHSRCWNCAVDRPSDRVDDQLVERVAGERLEVEPFAHPVLPQGDDGVGDVLAPPHGRQHPHAVLGHELVGQRGRGLVERVGVVDGEQVGSSRQDGLAAPGSATRRRRRRGAAERRRRGARHPTTGSPAPAGHGCPRRRPARPPRPGGGTCPRPPRPRARRPGGSPAPPRRGRARTRARGTATEGAPSYLLPEGPGAMLRSQRRLCT